ncbi:MAG: hypothetical protein OHK0045_15720 [Raineya sp.]
MKKIAVYIFVNLLFLLNVQGQNLYVSYIERPAYYLGASNTTIRQTLIVEDSLNFYSESPVSTNAISVPRSTITGNAKKFFVKNYNDGILYYKTSIPFSRKDYMVADSLHPMKWERLKETKVILNYKCGAAQTTFRGRTYKAYFTEKIPVSTGPWKFGGLPGLILEVVSKDDDAELVWTVEKIIKNPKGLKDYRVEYKQYEFISWQEYTEKYKDVMTKKLAQLKADVASSPGEKGYIRITNPEIIDKRSDTGKGLEY